MGLLTGWDVDAVLSPRKQQDCDCEAPMSEITHMIIRVDLWCTENT